MQVRVYPDPALRRGGKTIESFDATIAQTAEEMMATMYEQRGVGLAAPQVGLDVALLVLNPTGDPKDSASEMALLNPRIVGKKGKEFGEEGCLSFPGIYAEVERAVKITVVYQDLQGQEQELRTEGFLARVIQHELDHIEGVLFVDRLTSIEKLRVKSQLQDLEKRFQSA